MSCVSTDTLASTARRSRFVVECAHARADSSEHKVDRFGLVDGLIHHQNSILNRDDILFWQRFLDSVGHLFVRNQHLHLLEL